MARKRRKKSQEVRRRAAERWPPDLVPTGSEVTSEGSSVRIDSGMATKQELPSTEEILRKAEKAHRKARPRRHRAPPAPRVRVPEEEEKEISVPHDKAPMQEIE